MSADNVIASSAVGRATDARANHTPAETPAAKQSTVELLRELEATRQTPQKPETALGSRSTGHAAMVMASEDEVNRAINQVNDVLTIFDKGISFKVEQDSGDVIVQLVNKETNEVIRTIPPQAMLDMMARLHDVVGLLLDERM